MADEKIFQSRIQLKHDIEENWLKATNFVPKEGEIVIYDVDANNPTPRFKVGNGTTVVNLLPFVAAQADWNITDENNSGYIKNRPFYTTDDMVLTELVNVSKMDTNYIEWGDPPFFLVPGQAYTVEHNGMVYENVICWTKESEFGTKLCLGDDYKTVGTNYTFAFSMVEDGTEGASCDFSTEGNHTFRVTSLALRVVTIEDKYLSENIVRADALRRELAEYVTYSELHELSEDIFNIENELYNKVGNSQLTETLSNYYTKDEIGSALGELATKDYVDEAIGDINVPITSVNGKTGAVNLTASDVGALPSTTTIPTKVSDLTNDSGFTTNTGTITSVKANGTSVATSGEADIPAASTSKYGVTKLSSSTSSTSTSLAATPSAVKSAYDLAKAALPSAGGTMTGALIAQNNTDYTTPQVRNAILIADGDDLPAVVNGGLCFLYQPVEE